MRVIAGALGGRRLAAPRGPATRPTSDRVREALFSILGDVSGDSVLDLFAGTGALGIEALSRGATGATFVENARPALVTLRKNLTDLALVDRSTVLSLPALQAVSLARGPFDLVFVDPPYAALATVPPLVSAFESRLAEGARLVLEHAARDASPALPPLVLELTRRYGDTSLSFYTRVSASPAPPVS